MVITSASSPYIHVDTVLQQSGEAEVIQSVLSRRIRDLFNMRKSDEHIMTVYDNCPELKQMTDDLQVEFMEGSIDNEPFVRIRMGMKIRVPESDNFIVHESQEISKRIPSAMLDDVQISKILSMPFTSSGRLIYTDLDWISMPRIFKGVYEVIHGPPNPSTKNIYVSVRMRQYLRSARECLMTDGIPRAGSPDSVIEGHIVEIKR